MFGVNEDDLTSLTSLSLYRNGTEYKFDGNRHKETFRLKTAKAVYTYDDGTPAITENDYGKGKAIMSGINLGLCYSSKKLIGDDLLRTATANSSKASKNIVIDISMRAKVRGNRCSASDVKASYLKNVSEKDADIIILINSASDAKSGEYVLDREYAACTDIFGDTKCSLNENRLSFALEAGKSAVIMLSKE